MAPLQAAEKDEDMGLNIFDGGMSISITKPLDIGRGNLKAVDEDEKIGLNRFDSRDLMEGAEDINSLDNATAYQKAETATVPTADDDDVGLHIFDSSAPTLALKLPVSRPRGPKRKTSNPVTQNHGGRSSRDRDFDKNGGAWRPT